MTDEHKAAVAGRALFGKAWGQLSKKQQADACKLVESISAAPKAPKEADRE